MPKDMPMKTASKNQNHRAPAMDQVLEYPTQMVDTMIDNVKEYAKERPEVVVLWAFGIGFVLGWKLKPW
jgi:hypothetical protein